MRGGGSLSRFLRISYAMLSVCRIRFSCALSPLALLEHPGIGLNNERVDDDGGGNVASVASGGRYLTRGATERPVDRDRVAQQRRRRQIRSIHKTRRNQLLAGGGGG